MAGHKKLAKSETKPTELCLQLTRAPGTVTGTVSMNYTPEYVPLRGYVTQAFKAGAVCFASPALGTLDENNERQGGCTRQNPVE